MNHTNVHFTLQHPSQFLLYPRYQFVLSSEGTTTPCQNLVWHSDNLCQLKLYFIETINIRSSAQIFERNNVINMIPQDSRSKSTRICCVGQIELIYHLIYLSHSDAIELKDAFTLKCSLNFSNHFSSVCVHGIPWN